MIILFAVGPFILIWCLALAVVIQWLPLWAATILVGIMFGLIPSKMVDDVRQVLDSKLEETP